MTPERARLLEAVAEAAEAVLVRWDTLAARRVMRARIDALRAHDAAPQVVGETVEIAVWEDPDDGDIMFARPGGKMDNLRLKSADWRRFGIARLSIIPTTVDEVKR